MYIVPKIPTDYMIKKGKNKVDIDISEQDIKIIYAAILQALPRACTGCYYEQDTIDMFSECHRCCRDYKDQYTKEKVTYAQHTSKNKAR